MGNLGEDHIPLVALGTRVDVVPSGSGAVSLAESLRSAWDRCIAPASAPHPRTRIEVVLDPDPAVVASAHARGLLADTDEQRLMSTLTSRVTLAAIESRHGELLMLHACALAHPVTGDTIVLVAPSGTGKTTAALNLGTELGYLTDECVGIDMDDTVVPYPKPLSILSDDRPPKHQVSPSRLDLLEAPTSPRVVAVALLDRKDEPVAPSVEQVPTLEALAAVAGQSSAIQKLPKPLHLLAGLLERTGGLRRITYHEIIDASPIVDDLVGRGGRS